MGTSVTGPWRWPLYTDIPCHSRCGTLKKTLLNDHTCPYMQEPSIGQNLQPFTGNDDISIWLWRTKKTQRYKQKRKGLIKITEIQHRVCSILGIFMLLCPTFNDLTRVWDNVLYLVFHQLIQYEDRSVYTIKILCKFKYKYSAFATTENVWF